MFVGEYKGGKPIADNPLEVQEFFRQQTGRFEATFCKESDDITKRQRGFYYGKLLPAAAKQTGHTIEELDGVLHRAFLTVNKGKPLEYVRSTSDGSMSKEEYTEYIRLCVQRLAEHGIDAGDCPR